MKLIADLHIHSHFSRATSKNLNFFHLAKWAQIKGVQIVGTGDISHPGWLAEMHENLEPAEQGLFRLKEEIAAQVKQEVPANCQGEVRFMLAGEISSIYKKGERTRKVHNVIFAPSLEVVATLQVELEKIGNIRSDGRPILGLPSRDLLEIILGVDDRCHLIPAHIWTPWFSMLGSKSGYDSIEECFEDLTPHIFALETGLSSDPPMNWRVSNLDGYTLVSNSDAHSPPKLAREATLFDCERSYDAMFSALKSGDPATFKGTLEFFPEEGKYHQDGHRKCGVNWKPAVTIAHGGVCSVCGKKVTVGVGHRVEELADRPQGGRPASAKPYFSLIPLPEIISELVGVGPNSKRVQREYQRLLTDLGPELAILLDLPLDQIAGSAGDKLAAGIGRMRLGEVNAIAGYDGEFGIIKLFDRGDSERVPQMNLFGDELAASSQEHQELSPDDVLQNTPQSHLTIDNSQLTVPKPPVSTTQLPIPETPNLHSSLLQSLNSAQGAAVETTDVPLIIVAGPGTGKTRTLTTRIAYLIQKRSVAPESILAITFTNKAAGEMAERLETLVGDEIASATTIKTFHAFGTLLLRQYGQRLDLDPDFAILSEDDRRTLLKRIAPDLSQKEIYQCLDQISAVKNNLLPAEDLASHSQFPIDNSPFTIPLFDAYQTALTQSHALDFDDLATLPVQLLEAHTDILLEVQDRFRWLSVDEYQDINDAQYRLLRLLTSGGANLSVIGDPDQAIYGFRGADYRHFLQFEADFPEAVRLRLSQNYRSTQMILDAATQVISRNPDRVASDIFSEFADQVKLDVYTAPTDKAEAEYVVHQIEQMVGGTSYFSLDSGRVEDDTQSVSHSFGDFAVLYRLNALARPLVEAFERSGIPYQTVGQTPFFAHKDIKEVLAWLWLVENPAASLHKEIAGNRKEIEVLRGGRETSRVAELADQAGQVMGLDADKLRQLTARARPFGTDLRAFLEMTALGSETDFYDQRADRVTLITLHAAKGLEFPVVFMAGCEEGLLPYERVGEEPDIEEERRLFYVGMTRAQQKLILSHARSRFLFGQRLEKPVSRFVGNIENALKESLEAERRKRNTRKVETEQLSLF
ncbi:MAG: UvrD-helicase domain-containing protein [Chloroflexi bacterium]|nr:UvrD-helicase domain-containing protein [Chloroflexota bacterium]